MTKKLNEFALPLTSVMAIGKPIGYSYDDEADDTISFAAASPTADNIPEVEPQVQDSESCTLGQAPPDWYVTITADKIVSGGFNNDSCQTFDISFNVFCSSPKGSAYESECYTVVKRITVDKSKILDQARQQASQAVTMLENKKLKEAIETKKRFRILAGLE